MVPQSAAMILHDQTDEPAHQSLGQDPRMNPVLLALIAFIGIAIMP